jgi:hypothetical protein
MKFKTVNKRFKLNDEEFELVSITTIVQHFLVQTYKNDINFKAS